MTINDQNSKGQKMLVRYLGVVRIYISNIKRLGYRERMKRNEDPKIRRRAFYMREDAKIR